MFSHGSDKLGYVNYIEGEMTAKTGTLADLLGVPLVSAPAEVKTKECEVVDTPTVPDSVVQEHEEPVQVVQTESLDDGAEPPPVVQPSETVDTPAQRRSKNGFAKAQAARSANRSARINRGRAIIEDLAKEDLKNKYWVARTKRVLMRELNIPSETALNNFIVRDVGMRGGLTAYRLNRMEQSDLVEKGDGELPTSELLKWTILDLFDRLMHHFDVVKDDDDDDPLPADAGDVRRTWTAWRVFLAAAFGVPKEQVDKDHAPEAAEPMPAYPGVADGSRTPRGVANVPPLSTAQQIFELCTGRTTWPAIRAKLVNLIVGRRGGKSYITAIIGIYLATRKYKLKLGTKGMVMILARDKEQAGVIRGYIMAFLKVLPELVVEFAAQPTQQLIELKSGITIEVRATGAEGTRGYTVVAVLADEVAFWPTNDESVRQDKKVLRALRPAMLGVTNPMTILLSSPYAQRGVLYDNWKKYFGKDEKPKFLVWQADTLTMRPSDEEALLEEIQDEYEDDPENAAAEYGANFRSDLEDIFSKLAVEKLCTPGAWQRPYNPDHDYRAFVDPSGGSADSYVVAIAHDEERKINGETVTLPVLDFLEEFKPPFDPAAVSLSIVQRCQEYHIYSVTGDAYGGEWPRDPLKKKGVDYVLSEMNRSELYLAFLPLVNSGMAELLDADKHVRMVNQFANLQRRVGRSGKDSVDHPPGSHDDVSNAVAGVMVCEGGPGQECTF